MAWLLVNFHILLTLTFPLGKSLVKMAAASILSVIIDGAIIRSALKAIGLISRFNQTFCAQVGSGALFTFIANILMWLLQWSEYQIWDTLLAVILFLNVVWMIVVHGIIYQNAMELSLKQAASIIGLVFIIKFFFIRAVLG